MMESEIRRHLQDLQCSVNNMARRLEALECKPDAAPPKPDNPLRLPWKYTSDGWLTECDGRLIDWTVEKRQITASAVNRWEDAKMLSQIIIDWLDADDGSRLRDAALIARRILAEKDTQ